MSLREPLLAHEMQGEARTPLLYASVPRLWSQHVFSDRVDTRLVPLAMRP